MTMNHTQNTTKNKSAKATKTAIKGLLGLFVIAVIAFGVWRMMPTNAPDVKDEKMPIAHEPVVYDVSSWTISPKSRQMQEILGHLGTATADEALDYYGNVAQRYRYTAHHEAPLYVVVGDGVMEVVWYHASAKDDVALKTQSQTHAQKVHALTTAIYGAEGQALMQAMLLGDAPNKSIPKLTGLIDAHCQTYQCRLVINTDKLGINQSKH